MKLIQTKKAPQAIGTYSQAIQTGNTVYLSGQIGLDPKENDRLHEGIEQQIEQVILNLESVCVASGGALSHLVKVGVYLTDLNHFSKVNEAMARHFSLPYPARAVLGVSCLPRGALIEMDGVLVLPLCE